MVLGITDGANEGSDDGINEGSDEGADDGIADGIDEGSDDGMEEGSDEGADDGAALGAGAVVIRFKEGEGAFDFSSGIICQAFQESLTSSFLDRRILENTFKLSTTKYNFLLLAFFLLI